MNGYRLGLVLVTASAVAWSTAGLFTRLLDTDTATTLVWRGLFGALGILGVMLVLEGIRSIRKFANLGRPGWMFALVSAAGMLLFIAALRSTTVAHVSVIYATVPFLAAALSWLAVREKPETSAVLASVAALAGVAIMVGFDFEGNLVGDLLALGMTLTLATMMVIARKYPRVPVMPAAAVSALVSGLACLPFAVPTDVGTGELGLLALFGLVNSAAGLALFTLGARLLPAIETALIGALDAPMAPFWVWLIFSETPSAATLIGGAIVFAAVAAHMLTGIRKQPLSATEPARAWDFSP